MTASNAAAPATTHAAPHHAVNFGVQFHNFAVAVGDWLATHWLQIIIAAAIGAVIAAVLYGIRALGTRLCRPGRQRTDWPMIIGRAIGKTNSFFIIMVAVRLVDRYAVTPHALDTVVEFLFTVAAVFQGATWARELILGAIEHRTSAEDYRGEAVLNAMGLIRLLISVAVFAIALVVLLGNLGVNVTGLVAGLGVGGIAIGLAAQGIFADLFAALAIIFDRPFSRGDAISYGDSSGTIESIGLKSTRIRAYTGELRIISNKNLLDKEILNVTERDHIRLSFTISIARETRPDALARLPAILKELVEAEGGKAARAGFDAFGPSSFDFALQVDVPGGDWSIAHPLRDRLLVSIVKRFAAEGISMAYPAQTTFAAAPDGDLIMPYPSVQPVTHVDVDADGKPAAKD